MLRASWTTVVCTQITQRKKLSTWKTCGWQWNYNSTGHLQIRHRGMCCWTWQGQKISFPCQLSKLSTDSDCRRIDTVSTRLITSSKMPWKSRLRKSATWVTVWLVLSIKLKWIATRLDCLLSNVLVRCRLLPELRASQYQNLFTNRLLVSYYFCNFCTKKVGLKSKDVEKWTLFIKYHKFYFCHSVFDIEKCFCRR